MIRLTFFDQEFDQERRLRNPMLYPVELRDPCAHHNQACGNGKSRSVNPRKELWGNGEGALLHAILP